jgi:hypothetical protein
MPFGGRNGLVCSFSQSREKYSHNGGMAFAHHWGDVVGQGSTISIAAPTAAP